MKRIVDGVTYNTDTSTRLARKYRDGLGKSEKFVETLRQTRGGAYFLVQKHTVEKWDERERENALHIDYNFFPISATKAREWMLEGEIRVFQNPFGDDPPEAVAESEPGATIYLRVPIALKLNADAAAGEQGLSGNAWGIQCIERCLENRSREDVKDLACVWKLANTFCSHQNDVDWTRKQFLDAMSIIADCAYAAGLRFFGSKGLETAAAKLDGDPAYREVCKKLKLFA